MKDHSPVGLQETCPLEKDIRLFFSMEKINFHRGDIAVGGTDYFYDDNYVIVKNIGGQVVEMVEDTSFTMTAKIGGQVYRADPEDLPCSQGSSIPLYRGE